MSNNTIENSNKKARLGRGLGSLLSGEATGHVPEPALGASFQDIAPAAPQPVAPVVPAAPKIEETARIWNLSVERLRPNAQQPRRHFEPSALKELADSIRQKGILQPIVARRLDEKNFEIIAGERRWRAAQLAGLHEVPVILKKAEGAEILELAIIENIQRQDLNPMEEAEAYDLLMSEYGLTQQDVAEKVGKERATVANSLRLLVLPSEIKGFLRTNQLTAGHAKAILSVEDSAEQVSLAKRVVSEKLSVRATEKLATQSKRRDRPEGELRVQVSERLVESLAQELQKLLGTKVTIDYANSKGRISVYYYSDEELTQTIDKFRAAWQK